jgi:uncharacterized membrane protein (UPF0127 family)
VATDRGIYAVSGLTIRQDIPRLRELTDPASLYLHTVEKGNIILLPYILPIYPLQESLVRNTKIPDSPCFRVYLRDEVCPFPKQIFIRTGEMFSACGTNPSSSMIAPKQIAGVLILVFGILAVLYVMGCFTAPVQQSPAQEPIAEISREGTLKARIYLEVADTPQEREQGLMNRTSLAPDHGMLFVFEKPARYSFWMKNTLIPLDLLFIDSGLTIVDIKPNTTPLDLTPVTADSESLYALEVNAGFCESHEIKEGDDVRFIFPEP